MMSMPADPISSSASRLDGIGQTVELTSQEQAGGSVVVSLSVQLGHLGENE